MHVARDCPREKSALYRNFALACLMPWHPALLRISKFSMGPVMNKCLLMHVADGARPAENDLTISKF